MALLLFLTWWRHQMETFSSLLALCEGNSPVTGEFPSQRPVTRSFDVFIDLHLNKRLSKQSLGWSFETPSCSLWRQCKWRFQSLKIYNTPYELCIQVTLCCVLLLSGTGWFYLELEYDIDSQFVNIHFNDVIMSVMASQITSITIVYPSIHSGADQRKHQSSAWLAFVGGIHTKGQWHGKC